MGLNGMRNGGGKHRPFFLRFVFIYIFPGFIFLFVFSLFTEYLDRKIYARIQRRVGPPFLQPFADLVKLSAKEDFVPENAERFMFTAAPIIGLAAIFAAFLYLPIVSYTGLHSFNGDLVVVLYLLTIPTLALFLGGWYQAMSLVRKEECVSLLCCSPMRFLSF